MTTDGAPVNPPDTHDAPVKSSLPSRAPGQLPLLLAVLALIASLAVWLSVRADLGEIRTTQRQLAADLASLRGPTIDVTGAPALGRPDAVVTFIEFSDYECPFCVRHFTQTMPRLQANYIDTGKIRYVFKDFPIDQLHPGAIRAHEAARCALEQDKFWDVHRALFSPPGTHTRPAIDEVAKQAGLDPTRFGECLDSGRTTAAVRQNVSLASSLGANGTPSFFIGLRDLETQQVQVYRAISGAQPYNEFEKAIAAVSAYAR
jgi:protein-disulfide isomerase